MENDKLEIVRLKNLNEASKKTIGDLKKRIEDLMTENYELGKAKESKDVELENTKTENRRLQESVDLFNQMKKSISDKLAESKDLKSKQTETFQEIIKNLLVMVKAYQKYTDTVERSFVSSYENLLLLVDYKFDAIREAKKEVTKIELDPKQRKLLLHSPNLLWMSSMSTLILLTTMSSTRSSRSLSRISEAESSLRIERQTSCSKVLEIPVAHHYSLLLHQPCLKTARSQKVLESSRQSQDQKAFQFLLLNLKVQ